LKRSASRAVAIDSARLHQRVLDVAVVEERERIARELHDGLAQVLGYINTETLALKKLVASGRFAEAERELSAMEASAKQVYADVREAILGLKASSAQPGQLLSSLRDYLKHYSEMAGIKVALKATPEFEALKLPPLSNPAHAHHSEALPTSPRPCDRAMVSFGDRRPFEIECRMTARVRPERLMRTAGHAGLQRCASVLSDRGNISRRHPGVARSRSRYKPKRAARSEHEGIARG
jgi:hypothetical protein